MGSFRCFTSSQSPPRSTQSRKVLSENFVSAKKVKIYDSFSTKEMAIDKLVKEFLITLESATFWLDIRDCCV